MFGPSAQLHFGLGLRVALPTGAAQQGSFRILSTWRRERDQFFQNAIILAISGMDKIKARVSNIVSYHRQAPTASLKKPQTDVLPLTARGEASLQATVARAKMPERLNPCISRSCDEPIPHQRSSTERLKDLYFLKRRR